MAALGAVIAMVRPAGGRVERDGTVWGLIAIGLVGVVAAEALRIAFGSERWYAPVHSLAVLVIVVAMAQVLRRTAPERRGGRTDALIAAVGFALVSWIFVLDPIATRGDIDLIDRLVSMTTPILGIVLFTMILRLAFVVTVESLAARLLIGGGLTLIAADVLGNVTTTHSIAGGASLSRLMLVGAALAFAVAASHPLASTLVESSLAARRGITTPRLVLLAVAAIAAPAALLVRTLLDTTVNVPVVVAGMIILFILIVIRMSELVRSQTHAVEMHRESTSREKTLRRAGHALVAATDRDAMFAVAIDAAETLVRDRPHWTVRLFAGPTDAMGLVATRGERPVHTPCVVDLASLPVDAGRALAMGDACVIRSLAEERPHIDGALGLSPARPVALIVPVVVDDDVTGILAVSLDRIPGESRRRALETVCAQAGLAVETAALTEDLHTRASEERFRSLIQNATDVILVVDRSGRVHFSTPSVTTLLGCLPNAIDGTNLAARLHPEDAAAGPDILVDGTTIEWRLRHESGDYRRVDAIVADMCDDPNVGGIVLTMRDVTERRELESRLAHQAFHDPLTGLANRALFEDRIGQALARRVRRPTGNVAVVFLDLDDFKAVNDTLGHQAGDELLLGVAKRLSACLRPTDTAARLGGDEFAIALDIDDFDCEHVIGLVTERLVTAFQEPFDIEGREIYTRSSVGIAVTPEGGVTVEELLRNADIAMYAAKRNGKGTVHRFTANAHSAVARELSLTGDLRRALEHNEFRLHFQPIVELATTQVRGLEALVRWEHPEHGPISPAEFIGVAEQTGAIGELGRWILHEACRQFQEWAGQSPRVRDWFISVNISGHQLRRGDLFHVVTEAIASTGIDPRCLVLELTESVLMDNTEHAIAVLETIRDLGVRVAIDDFGTGFSSLAYLKRLPVDVLKLAAPFVHGLSGGDEPLTGAIIHLSRTLGLDVVAEGIEHRSEANSLRTMNCAMGQGYFFSRPLSVDQVRTAVDALGAHRPTPTAI